MSVKQANLAQTIVIGLIVVAAAIVGISSFFFPESLPELFREGQCRDSRETPKIEIYSPQLDRPITSPISVDVRFFGSPAAPIDIHSLKIWAREGRRNDITDDVLKLPGLQLTPERLHIPKWEIPDAASGMRARLFRESPFLYIQISDTTGLCAEKMIKVPLK